MLKYSLLSAAMAGLLLGGTTALAQTAGTNAGQLTPPKSGPQHSTPAEEAQTYLLNQRAKSGFYAPPAVLNGKASGGLKQAEADSSRQAEAYDQSQAAYQQAQRQYQQNLQKYRQEREAWSQSQRDYRAAITRFDQPKWAFHNFPHLTPVAFDAPQLVPLGTLNPPQSIAGAPLQGPDGWEGWVIGWQLRPNGQRGLQVALNRHFAVWVPPGEVRFDQKAAVAVTSLDRTALWGEAGVYLKDAYTGGAGRGGGD
jgi:hypothetical protein